jgi:hypothetical protein
LTTSNEVFFSRIAIDFEEKKREKKNQIDQAFLSSRVIGMTNLPNRSIVDIKGRL